MPSCFLFSLKRILTSHQQERGEVEGEGERCWVFRPVFGWKSYHLIKKQKLTKNHFFNLFQLNKVKFTKNWWKKTEKGKNELKKMQNWGTPSGSWPAFGCRPALKSSWNHCNYNLFLFWDEKSLKNIRNQQKRLIISPKSVLTSFGGGQHPKAGWNTPQKGKDGICSWVPLSAIQNWKLKWN